jgi:hypothetical protein
VLICSKQGMEDPVIRISDLELVSTFFEQQARMPSFPYRFSAVHSTRIASTQTRLRRGVHGPRIIMFLCRRRIGANLYGRKGMGGVHPAGHGLPVAHRCLRRLPSHGRDEELLEGGMYYGGKVLQNYTLGQIVQFEVDVYVHHNGFMELVICDLDACGKGISTD